MDDADEDISGVYLELRRHLVRDALFRPHPTPYYDHCKTLRALKTPKVTASLAHPVTTGIASGGLNYAQILASDGSGPERFIAAKELREEIRVAIDRAAPSASTVPRDRSIFQLFFVERLTVDEIARKRSIRLSGSGVEKRIRRMREALKEKFSTV